MKTEETGRGTARPLSFEASAVSRDAEPLQPIEWMKWVLNQLAAIPWVACGAIGTGFGVALLYFYFASIEFVPADIPAILSASLLVAMLAFAFYAWVVVCLIAPLAAYRGMELHVEETSDEPDQAKSKASLSGLWALQFLGVGGLLVVIGLPQWLKCMPLSHYPLGTGVVFVGVGVLGWMRSETRMGSRRRAWKKRLGLALLVSVAGALPFVVLVQLLVSDRGAEWVHLIAFLAAWLTVVATSAFVEKIPVWGCALLLTILSPVLMYSLPGLLGFPAFFPTKVAQIAGIRSPKAVELRLPLVTCQLIESAMGNAVVTKTVNCHERSGWGSAHAHVLSNLGERWLIELPLDGDQPHGRNGAVRVSIPGDGVQTVRRIAPPPLPDRAIGCPT